MDAGMVRQVNIDEEMRGAYLDYAMSVIVSRALPDVRDGLKPVHRRILYAMYDMGLRPDSAYKKSARIVGEVLGKYHPHGDASVYDAMVRMAQDFSVRYELVDGQGNFGSIDGDSQAAMRYTEARLANFGFDLLTDIGKETVDFQDNFDGSLREPAVMPASVPNLLVNGSSGIAVGMSTSIPPHNLGEICDAIEYMLEHWEKQEDITVQDLMQFVKGPDFPTAGIVFPGEGEENGLLSAYATGKGKITMRAKAHIEDVGRGRSRIIVTEIPFQTNKTTLIERIVAVAQEGKIEGLVDLRDESDRNGLRIVIEIGRTADSHEVLAALFKYTPLESTFGIIMLALMDGEPRTLSLKQMLRAFIEHRLEVIRRRSEYDLSRAEARAHILEGLLTAVDNIDEVISIIRKSRTTESAHANLMKSFKLSEEQATAILDMQLRRLAALERKKLQDELAEKQKLIKDLKTLLSSQKLMRLEIGREIAGTREKYADHRRTIIAEGAKTDVVQSGGVLLGEQDDTWVTLTVKGRISRPINNEAPKVAASMKEPPYRVLQSNPSDTLYAFTEHGMCATMPTSQVPRTNEIEDGIPFQELFDLTGEDMIAGVLSLPPGLEQGFVFFASEGGEVKRLSLEDLPGMRANAFKVFDVEAGDRLRWVNLVQEDDTFIIVTRYGQAIQFEVSEVRSTGLSAGGMRGIKLADEKDRVVGAGVVTKFSHVWLVTEGGIGKRSSTDEYPIQGRAGQGVRTFRFPPGEDQFLAGALVGQLDSELVALTNKNTAKRNRITNAPSVKRDYKGDTVVSLAKGESVVEVFQFEPRIEVRNSSDE